MEVKIEKGVPFVRRNRHENHWPWELMDIGDSFFLPCEVKAQKSKQASMVANGNQWSARHGGVRRFASSVVEGGIRIWRVADRSNGAHP